MHSTKKGGAEPNEENDSYNSFLRSCHGFSGLVRMEITVVLAFIIAVYLFMLLTGGFNDLIEHRKKINRSRKEWRRINKHRQ